MEPNITLSILAAAGGQGGYINPIKVGVAVVLLFIWAVGVQWIDRDTDVVKTKREQWNLIVLSGGLVAYFVLLIPPWHGGLFVLGLAFWALIAGGAMIAYLMHRNSRVVPDARVLTVSHAKRLMSSGRTRKKAATSKGIRVRLADHEGNFLDPPEDPAELVSFDAVQDFLYDVLWRRADDVDMVAGKEKYRLVYKIDGVASEHKEGVPPEDGERIFRYLKQIGGLNVEEIRRPQTGRIQVALLAEETEPGVTEVHTSGTMAGERLRLHVQKGPVLLRLPELGMAHPRLEMLKTFLGKSKGMFLISAPPGHGLTTTQYAVVRSHDAFINNIHSVERHARIELDNITQHIYDGSNAEVNFARTVQTVLRREPDIILVGECEDRETALVATRAAVEDRKLYMGLHAKDSFEALTRYVGWINDTQVAAKALLGVLNQRLVRVLCTECREAFKPDPATLKKLNLPADKIERFYRPPTETKVGKKGREVVCPKCRGSGYVGRTGIFELLAVDPVVAKLIAEGSPINRIKAQCRKNKMYYLQEEGLLKVIDGTTSMNEILRCLRTSEK